MYSETIEVTASDQVRSKIRLYHSHQAEAPVIIIMPAMGVKASFYEPLARAVQREGFSCVTADLRGHGSSSVRPSRKNSFGYQDMVEKDWPAIIHMVKLHCPGAPVWLMGHSLGGQLSALYMSLEPAEVAGLILIASCSVYWRGFAQPFKTLLATQLLRILAEVVGYMPGQSLGFAGLEARQVIRDWARNARTGRYVLENSPLDYDLLLQRLTHPVLAISFVSDHYAPRKAVANLCQKMPNASLLHRDLSIRTNLGQPVNHFNWVKSPEPVISEVIPWLKARTLASGQLTNQV